MGCWWIRLLINNLLFVFVNGLSVIVLFFVMVMWLCWELICEIWCCCWVFMNLIRWFMRLVMRYGIGWVGF